MAQAKDLNISPYYDDFDPSNNFYKVLFKPSLPVQARELTNLQSILQNQIESFGSHMFKEGSIVIPGAPTYDLSYNAVKLNSTQFGIDVSLYVDQLVGKIVEGQTSGVTASVDLVALPDDNDVEDLTIYVKYLNSGISDPTLTEFINGEVLLTKENIVYGNTTINADTAVATLIPSDATAVGSAAFVAEGVYFIRGTFVNVNKQTIILDHYTNTPSYKIGLNIDEEIISAKDDPSLYDNAQGFTNYAAPGADRFKITLTLTKKLIDDTNDQNFFEILRIVDGYPRKIVSKTEYNHIKDYFAKRTFEESGNYAVDPFNISTVDSLNDRLGNDGQFFSDQKTEEGNTPSDDLMCVKVSGGRAYVRGYDVTTDSLTILDVDKPRDVEKIEGANIDFEFGNRLVLNNLRGQPQYRKVVDFYDQVNSTGNVIGQGRIYTLNAHNTTYSGASSKWNLYIYDAQLRTKLTLATSVTTTDIPTTSRIKGLSSGATAYAVSVSGTTVWINQVNGTFIANERISVNGVSKALSISLVSSYSSRDIRSVKQAAAGSYTKNFLADVSFTGSPLPNGITEGSINSNVLTAGQGRIFTGIKKDDIIQYKLQSQADITYNKVSSVSSNGLSLTLAVMGQDVSGVYYGSGIGNTTVNIKLATGSIWPSSSSNSGLYEVLPQPNISSVDFSNSNLSISAQITGESVSGAAATVSVANIYAGGGTVAISSAFFDSYNVSKYSVHYGNVSDGIGTVTSDSFTLIGDGDQAQFTGLRDDTSTVINITAKKQGIQSKIKNCEKSKLLSVNLSRLDESGTNEGSSIDDGLTVNTTAYGMRVQDEEISLNVPDVVKVLSVYESINNSQPTFDTLLFNSTVNVLNNAIIGEDIVGQTSGSIARIVTNNSSTPSSGNVNKLGIVYLNGIKFLKNETVIFKESNITTYIDGINTSDTDGQYQDISKSFILDKGQKDQYYDYSKLIRKTNSRIPSKQLLIVYDHYTVPVDDVGDVFSVLSYNKDRYTNDIPLIGDSAVRATDTLDFRPRVSTWSSNASSPFAFASRTSSFNSLPKFLVYPTGSSLMGYEYYLGRIDKLYLTEYGNLSLVRGQSSKEPKPPSVINNAMELATINLPPYLYRAYNTSIILTDNTRYTMRDIGLLEDRIENLEEVTTLSLLEVSTESLTITDADGNNRFKSGFFVDNFSTTDLINKNSSSINVDTANGEIKAIISQNSLQSLLLPSTNIIDEELDYGVNYELLDSNVQKTGKAVTLKYDEVDWIEQRYATRVENVNPFHVLTYTGTVTLTPSSDTWNRTIKLDDLVINNLTIVDKDITKSIRRTVDDPSSRTKKRWREEGFEKISSRRWRKTRNYTVQGEVQLVGTTVDENILVDSGDDLYMRSRNTQFVATNIKPLTKFYQFLDGNKDVAYIPKLVQISSDPELTSDGSNGVFQVGETVKAFQISSNSQYTTTQLDEYGQVLPVGTFRVATTNHKFGSYNNPSEVYDINPYSPTETLAAEYTNSSKILNLDILSLTNEAQGDYSGFLWKGVRLIGQTSGATAFVKEHQLISDNYGDLIGSFWLEDPLRDPPPTVRIETGRKVYRLNSDISNKTPVRGSTLISLAQVPYESKGTFGVLQDKIVNNRERIDKHITETTTIRETYSDPLAQSFNVGGNVEAPDPNVGMDDDQHGAYITAVDVFFYAKDTGNNPVTLEIRTVELGIPTKIVLGTPVTLSPSDITVSDDASAATKFTFPEPIYLAPGLEYAVVLLAPTSNLYEVHIARMGENAVNVQNFPNVGEIQYNQQWALGSLFKSQNGSVWSPSQMEDLKMKLYKAKFTSTSGTVFFANPTLSESNGYVEKLGSNSIITLPKTGSIGITTIATGHADISKFTPGRKIAGHSNDKVTAYVVGTGSSVAGHTGILTGGTGYQQGTTSGTVETFNIIGKGSGYKLNNVVVDANGVVTGFATANVGTGYTGGDIVGIKTSDMDGDIGNGARLVITDVGGIDTLYLSNIKGTSTAGKGGFIEDQTLRYFNDSAVITTLSGTKYLNNLTEDGAPYDGKHMRIDQFDHGMYSSNNKLKLSNIPSNLEFTSLTVDLTDDSTTVSVASTLSPDLNTFEGLTVSGTNPGYILIRDEIIQYDSVGVNVLNTISRGKDSTLSIPHYSGDSVHKYELNGVSLRRLNTEQEVANVDIELDSYYVGFDRTSNGVSRNVDATGIPQLSFDSLGFFGGDKAHATRNIQFDSILLDYNIRTPSSVTGATGSIRTVSGTSIGGNETSFIDQGYEPVQLSTLNKLTTPRLVCSKLNETEYLDNIERNKSFTSAITFSTGNENVSPILYTDQAVTTFMSNRLNNPITNYADNDLVKSSIFDPHSAIYVSNTIRLNKPADSLKVIFSAYRHASSDIRVLYTLVRPGSNIETEPEFVLFPGYDNNVNRGVSTLVNSDGEILNNTYENSSRSTGNPDEIVPASVDGQFLEYQYTADNLGEFTGYAIKIVMSGTNQAETPRISELRTIAIK